MKPRPLDPWILAFVLIGLAGSAGIIWWATDRDVAFPSPQSGASR
jgi:hypothetical protein